MNPFPHPTPRTATRSSPGFTLVELLVVMAIAAILLVIAIPSFVTMTANWRIASQVNGFIGDLQFARAEAIKRGQNVVMCPTTNDPGSALPVCATAAIDWKSGWVVFSDPDGNGVIEAGETPVLRLQEPLYTGYSFTDTNSILQIVFNREGFAQGLPANELFTMTAPAATNANDSCVGLYTVGRAVATAYGATFTDTAPNPCL